MSTEFANFTVMIAWTVWAIWAIIFIRTILVVWAIIVVGTIRAIGGICLISVVIWLVAFGEGILIICTDWYCNQAK
jgi:hypothetical protein